MPKKRKRSKSKSEEEKYEKLLKRLKKIEGKLREKMESCSSEEEEPENPDAVSISEENQEEPVTDIIDQHQAPQDPANNQDMENEPPLDPNILQILGEEPSNKVSYGESMHKDLAIRWTHILLNGLPKESRTDIIKQYLAPENCKNVRAPKLNLEIKAAINEANIKKDLYSESKQNQLAGCLSAMGKVMNVALKTECPIEILKPLSDAGRLLCDLHYKESLTRRYAIINTLNKQTRDIIKNTKIDEFLFGSDLTEHLRSSKAIIKSGSELKLPPPPPAPPRPQFKQQTAQNTSVRGALNSKEGQRTTSESRPNQNNPNLRRTQASTSRGTSHFSTNRQYESMRKQKHR